MFDAVRNRKIIVKIFLILITLPFAFFGLDSYTRSGDVGTDVAIVGDSKITLPEFQQAWRERLDQLRAATGGEVDPALFETPDARRAVVEQLVDRRLLLLEASHQRLFASDAQLREVIGRSPELQEDGQFSLSKYEAVLRAQGYTQGSFEAQLRQDLMMQQLADAVAEGGFVSQAAASQLRRVMAEVRQVAEYRLSPAQFAGQTSVSDEAVRQAYDADLQRWQTPEQVQAEFVVLSPETLKSQVQIGEDEVRARFEARKSEFRTAEERRVRHILFDAADKELAQKVLAELNAGGDFSALAAKYSKDPGSAASGGDLGFIARGMMVKPFEEAAFSLQANARSGLVASEFGIHLIEVTAIKAGAGKSYDDVKRQLREEMEVQALQRRFAEVAEAFSNAVYEQADSLAPVVERYQLPLQQTAWIVKGKPATQPGSPFANAKLMTAIFSPDAIENKRNTDAIEIGPSTLVAARVVAHRPAAVQPFDKVMDTIRQSLVTKAAAEKARAAGEAVLADLRAGREPAVKWGSVQPVSRLRADAFAPEIVKAVLRADVRTLPAYLGVAGDGGQYHVLRIAGVEHPEMTDAQAQSMRTEYARLSAQEDYAAYVAALRTRYKVVINESALENKAP